jgi:hypothetical protein
MRGKEDGGTCYLVDDVLKIGSNSNLLTESGRTRPSGAERARSADADRNMIVVSFSQDDTGKTVLIQADTKITQCTADKREKTIASSAENQLCVVYLISGP